MTRKYTPRSKPSSDLQKLAMRVNWVTGCRLHKLNIQALGMLAVSAKTRRAVAIYNLAVIELKRSIKADYKHHKNHILSERKKLIDSNQEPDIV